MINLFSNKIHLQLQVINKCCIILGPKFIWNCIRYSLSCIYAKGRYEIAGIFFMHIILIHLFRHMTFSITCRARPLNKKIGKLLKTPKQNEKFFALLHINTHINMHMCTSGLICTLKRDTRQFFPSFINIHHATNNDTRLLWMCTPNNN